MDHTAAMETFSGNNLPLLWYSPPPFRMHHSANHTVELEWEKESSGSFQELFKLATTYQTTGSYFIKIEDGDLPGLDVKVAHLGNCKFRVDADGLSTYTTLAFYSKEDSKHLHIWHDKHHHHYRQTVRLNQYTNDEPHQKPIFDTGGSRPKGSVMAPMAGLVVKVLLENGAFVEEGQPILVLEAMKIEHVVKSLCAGYVDGLKVSPGEQVFDTSVLFSVKEKE